MSGDVPEKSPSDPNVAEARDSLEKISADRDDKSNRPDDCLAKGQLTSPQFAIALKDAEALLYYAASSGKLPIKGDQEKEEDQIVLDIVNANAALAERKVDRNILVSFWRSYSKLSSLTDPVTAESIEASESRSLTKTKVSAAVLVSCIIISSIFLFASNSTASDTIEYIDAQNKATLQLWQDFHILKTSEVPQGAPSTAQGPDTSNQRAAAFAGRALEELVEFSRRSNWLLESAARLHHWFNPPWIKIDVDELNFSKGNAIGVEHLRVPPDLLTDQQIAEEVVNQIKAYQRIRDYAISVYKTNTIIYGGISTYLLPTIYALLGAFLYGFRYDSRLIREKKYLRSGANNTRYFIAAIAGLVIGLFGSVLPKNVSLPALAVAFLVGYAVEAFFSRLDSLATSLKVQAPQSQSVGPSDGG
jgi:hypothetical protein